jgi:hypothetical protein
MLFLPVQFYFFRFLYSFLFSPPLSQSLISVERLKLRDYFNENTITAASKKLYRLFCAPVSEGLLKDVEELRFTSTEGRADENALVLTLVAGDFLDAAYAMASWS